MNLTIRRSQWRGPGVAVGRDRTHPRPHGGHASDQIWLSNQLALTIPEPPRPRRNSSPGSAALISSTMVVACPARGGPRCAPRNRPRRSLDGLLRLSLAVDAEQQSGRGLGQGLRQGALPARPAPALRRDLAPLIPYAPAPSKATSAVALVSADRVVDGIPSTDSRDIPHPS